MTSLIQDFRFGLRTLRKSPAFTIIAVVTLALGIGANTAIFSIVNAVLLKPLPYPEPDRLLFVVSSLSVQADVTRPFAISYPDFLDWRATAKSFTGMASYHGDSFTLTGLEQPLHVNGSTVSGDFFNVVGQQPFLGRGFTREEEKPGTRVVVLSHQLWQTAFHGDRGIVGRAISIDKQSYTVVGVMPAGFAFPLDSEPPALWRTFATDGETTDPKEPAATGQRGAHFLRAVARLKPGVSIESAREEMNVITRNLARQYPNTNKKFSTAVVSTELEHLVGNNRTQLMILLVSVAVVLLIACLNVANLLLVRASKRNREIAVRAALGARRMRVVRQMLTESVVLGLAGAVLGLPLAIWALKVFISLNAQKMPRIQSAGLDGSVLAFTAAIALITSIVFGLVPALRASSPNLTEFMKEGRGTTAGSSHQRLRGILVVAETTLGLTLLVVAGLLLRSFHRILSVDPGMNPHNVLTVNFDLPDKKYNEQQQIQFYTQLLPRLQALPGVSSVAAVTPLPLSGQGSIITFEIEGRPVPKSDEPSADIKIITPNYFHTFNIPIVSGRDFTERDDDKAPGVVVVNQAFAQRFFPNENVLGKHITPGASNHGKPQPREIIGVVGNVKSYRLDVQDRPEYYIPDTQLNFGPMAVCLRTSVEPHSITSAVRGVVASMDPDLPLYDIKTMDEYLAATLVTPRFQSMLLEGFAGLALVLTAIGLYGVVSYAVAQRTHEIGVRITLGASRSNVVGMVLKSGLQLTAIGLAAGVVLSLIAGRFISSLSSVLFGVKPTDALTFAAVIAIVAVISLLACYIPARRASKVDPMIALRYE
ncbi:MAG TPA: ABC transporter permease [Candidatus Acidoferrales bacterium]|nr:ABC transporter permease [Candidatus Acidoferrales bacterium]